MATKDKENTVTTEENTVTTEKKETGEKMVTIMLPKTKDLRDDVPVWVNERSWLIQRGVEVKVPECVALVLQHQQMMEDQALAYEEFEQNASARHAGEIASGARKN